MGLDAPFYHLRMMLVQLLVLSAVLVVCAFWFRGRMETSTKRLGTVGLIAGFAALASAMDWVDCGRALPVLVLVGCVVLWKRARGRTVQETVKTVTESAPEASTQLKLGVNESGEESWERRRLAGEEVTPLSSARRRDAGAPGNVFPFLFNVFALFLLAKLGFYSRIWHYGFVLAMPAFCAAIYLLHWILPALLERVGVNRRLFRGTI